MNKRIVRLLVLLLLFTISKYTEAFNFASSGTTAYLNASVIPATLGNITSGSSDGATVVVAKGSPVGRDQDRIMIESVILDSVFETAGFTVEVGIGGIWSTTTAAVGRCVWYGTNCDVNQSSTRDNTPTSPVTIRLKRNSTASYSSISSGSTIATIVIRQYSNWTSSNGGDSATLIFKLNGELVPIIPTCDVKNFDKNVTLPDVKRTDLVSHGTGRYTGATKEFNINLECENSPKVSVKFDGDKMPGVTSEDVLVNKLSGNDNVGVQILYGSNPLQIGSNVAVLSAAGTNEALKFNAYYYYKGGTVQSGPIKSQTEFTFSYE